MKKKNFFYKGVRNHHDSNKILCVVITHVLDRRDSVRTFRVVAIL